MKLLPAIVSLYENQRSINNEERKEGRKGERKQEDEIFT